MQCIFDYGLGHDGKSKKYSADLKAHNTPIVLPDGRVLLADNWTLDEPPLPTMLATIEEPQPGTDIETIAQRVGGAVAHEVCA